MPILRRTCGTLRRGRRARSWPSRMTSPRRRELVADEQLDERRLAGARRADEEDEVALGDDQVDVAAGRSCRWGRCLVTSCRTRTARSGAAGRGRDPGRRRRSERAADGAGATVTGGSAGRRVAIDGRHRDRFGSTPSAGTAAGTTSAPRLPPARGPANVPAAHRAPDDGPVGRLRGGRARSARSAASRRTAGPSTAGPGTARGGIRPAAAPRHGPVRASPAATRERAARHRPRSQVAEDRRQQRGSRPATGPTRPAWRRSHSRAACRPVRGRASHVGSPGAGSGGRWDG